MSSECHHKRHSPISVLGALDREGAGDTVGVPCQLLGPPSLSPGETMATVSHEQRNNCAKYRSPLLHALLTSLALLLLLRARQQVNLAPPPRPSPH